MHTGPLAANSSDDAQFLQAGGELAALIRSKDWSQTAIGAIEHWPQSLRTVVSLCLGSNFPINIIWGAEATQIYNDGYRVVCGEVHPRALGEDYRVTWASAWPAIGAPFDQAQRGETSYLENQRMFLSRNGYLEETFFTFSHSPIRDESGKVAGLFHPVTETTASMLAERRNLALRDLGSALANAHDESALIRTAIDALSQHEYDLPYLLFYRFDAATQRYLLEAQTGIEAGLLLSPHSVPLGGSADWPFAAATESNDVLEFNNVAAEYYQAQCGPYPEPPHTAIALPLQVGGDAHAWGIFIAGVSPRLPFDRAYRTLFSLLGTTITSSLATVRAREDERRRAEALAEIDAAKTKFFSNVSHEFRTPLTLMLGPLEEILAGEDTPHRRQLETAHHNAQRLLRLVNSLLDFSRVEAARAKAMFRPTDLAALTTELASNFQSACELAGLSLIVNCPPLSETVYVDTDMWEKIVLNLMSNAFKFTHEGHIRLTLRAEDRYAILRVEDSGVGIPESDLQHVFERFHRVETTRGRSHEGTGIGLALVHELLSLLGGEISVESSVDTGTTFTLRVPLGRAHIALEAVDDEPAQVTPNASRVTAFVQEAQRWLPAESTGEQRPPPDIGDDSQIRVLLVDDNADMREYVRRILSARFSVETAADGLEALQVMRTSAPDLVVTDVMMPNLDGFGLVRAIREQTAFRYLPVILLSARAGEESRVQAADVGADDYLIKPFNADELIARITTNLQVAKLRRRAEESMLSNERERRISQAFQRAALPATLPTIPGLTFSYLYEPAGSEAQIGGDFYDAFQLLDGRLVVSIGDVAGSGLAAAATMSALRQSLRAVASVNPDPQMLLKAADDVFGERDGPAFASAFVAIVDPLTLSIKYASAGHPAPILRYPDGRIVMLEGNDLLLGVMPRSEQSTRTVKRVQAEAGAMLVLYTDGIIEHARDALAGERRLCEIVQEVAESPDIAAQFATRLYETVFIGQAVSNDDVAVLAMQFDDGCKDAQHQVLRFGFDAMDPLAARQARTEIVAALTKAGMPDDALLAAEIVYSELIGNVVRYATPEIEVLLDTARHFPVLHVIDSGEGFSQNSKLPADAYAERGRGLYIIENLTIDFTVSPRTLTSGSHARAVLKRA